MLPIMSSFNIAATSHPSSFATCAMCCPPHRPCSSADSPTRTTDVGKRYFESTRAASSTPAIPEALSFAPGASPSASYELEFLESMSPLMMT